MAASQPCGLAAPLEQTGTGDVRGLENAALEELQQMLFLAKKRVRFLEAAIAARAPECAHEWRVCFPAGPRDNNEFAYTCKLCGSAARKPPDTSCSALALLKDALMV